MVRPVVKFNNRSTEMEIKALKLSSEAKDNVRAPNVWERPSSTMYDYHYEISGLYYQPMIKYCVDKGNGLVKEKIVDLPDRLQSNYDRRSYKMKKINPNYEQFLIQLYQRRLKANNTKFSHCANELARMSKDTSEIGLVRDSGSMRDKYLTQLQLMYTEKLAQKGCVKGGIVQASGDDYLIDDTINEKEKEEYEKKAGNKMLSRNRADARYGPSFERITVLDSERYNMGEEVDFLEGCFQKTSEAQQTASASSEQKEVKIIRKVNGVVVDSETESKQSTSLNKDYLDAETLLDFLSIREDEKNQINTRETTRQLPFIYRDTTLSRATADVKDRVKNAGKQLLPQKPSMQEMNFNYRGKKLENIGRFERAYVRSSMYKNSALPDFDVGYDTI